MRYYRSLTEVARWEFLRYVKPKQQVVGLVITLAMFLGGAMLGRMGGEPDTVQVSVIGAENLATLPDAAGRFRFEPHLAEALPRLLAEVEARARDAVLVIDDVGGGELHTRQTPGWRPALERELTASLQRQRLAAMELDARQLAAVQAPFQLSVREVAPRAGGGERLAAWIALGLTVIGLFSGIGYVFSSVTGEKQNRLSEQVISTISPQAWIDGKILGLAAVAMVSILNALLSGALFLLIARALWGWAIPLPTRVERPELLLAALLLVFLGFLFWFAFLTAVAAIVDDPHTSTRNQLLFLPLLPMAVAYFAVSDPEATWIRVLSVVPPTSSAVMPIRLLVTEVPWWEALPALLLLVGAIWVVRRLAGKVFRLGMLMYGKEPSWREVRRWLREA